MTKHLIDKRVGFLYITARFVMIKLEHHSHLPLIINTVHHNESCWVERQQVLGEFGCARLRYLRKYLVIFAWFCWNGSEGFNTPFFYLFHAVVSFNLHGKSHTAPRIVLIEKLLQVTP